MQVSANVNQQTVDWKTILLSNILTFVVTIGASFCLYYFTQEKPELQFEVFPLSSFISNKNKISIINTKIENSGNKEAEGVSCFFSFNKNVIVKEVQINFSVPNIKYNINKDSTNNTFQCEIPTLNTGENCAFSFLLESKTDSLKTSDLQLSLRGKGVNGQLISERADYRRGREFTFIIIALILGISSSAISLIRSIKSYRDHKKTVASSNRTIKGTVGIAVDYCDTGQYEDSIRILKAMIYQYPKYSSSHSNLGRAYANVGKFQLAHSELKLAKELAQDSGDILVYNYIHSQVDALEGNLAEALHFLSEAVKIDGEKVRDKAAIDAEFHAIRHDPKFQEIIRNK